MVESSMPALKKRFAILGIGNPLLCDDTIGLQILPLLDDITEEFPDTVIIPCYCLGFEILEVLESADGALVIDCIVTGSARPGTCHHLSLEDLRSRCPTNLADSHGLNLPQLLEAGVQLGYRMPRDVRIIGVEGCCIDEFSLEPTPDVKEALPACAAVCRKIYLDLRKCCGCPAEILEKESA